MSNKPWNLEDTKTFLKEMPYGPLTRCVETQISRVTGVPDGGALVASKNHGGSCPGMITVSFLGMDELEHLVEIYNMIKDAE